MYTVVFFFFKQKTAYEMRISDWSSDVCSSDLVTALTAFILLTLPVLDTGNFSPFAPNGWFGPEGASGMGIVGAAASIFFAYVGFEDRHSVVWGKRVSVRVDLGGSRRIKTKNNKTQSRPEPYNTKRDKNT